jgi:hypothetical protein
MLARIDAKLEPIGEPIRSIEDLHAALRLRADELKISRQTVGELAGLTGGYAEKLLAPQPSKRLGALSTTLLMGALGCALILVEDKEALAKVRSRLVPHKVTVPSRACLWAGKARTTVSKRWVRQIARQGGHARAAALSPARRRAIAREAALIRWADVKQATAERNKPNGGATNGRKR